MENLKNIYLTLIYSAKTHIVINNLIKFFFANKHYLNFTELIILKWEIVPQKIIFILIHTILIKKKRNQILLLPKLKFQEEIKALYTKIAMKEKEIKIRVRSAKKKFTIIQVLFIFQKKMGQW